MDRSCYFLVHSASQRLLLFPGGLWMVAVISWWTLDGCCYSLATQTKTSSFGLDITKVPMQTLTYEKWRTPRFVVLLLLQSCILH